MASHKRKRRKRKEDGAVLFEVWYARSFNSLLFSFRQQPFLSILPLFQPFFLYTIFFAIFFLSIFICPCFFFPSQLIFFFFLIFAAFLTNVELQLFPFSRLSRFSSYVRCTDRNISVMTHTGSIAVHGINFFLFFCELVTN